MQNRLKTWVIYPLTCAKPLQKIFTFISLDQSLRSNPPTGAANTFLSWPIRPRLSVWVCLPWVKRTSFLFAFRHRLAAPWGAHFVQRENRGSFVPSLLMRFMSRHNTSSMILACARRTSFLWAKVNHLPTTEKRCARCVCLTRGMDLALGRDI